MNKKLGKRKIVVNYAPQGKDFGDISQAWRGCKLIFEKKTENGDFVVSWNNALRSLLAQGKYNAVHHWEKKKERSDFIFLAEVCSEI